MSKNRWARDALTAAREWHEKPRYILGLPSLDQSEVDRLLMLALTLHDLDLCPCKCGGYSDETLVLDGWHEAGTIICDRRRAMDELQSERDKPEPGEIVYGYLDRP